MKSTTVASTVAGMSASMRAAMPCADRPKTVSYSTKTGTPMKPTLEQFTGFQAAFDYFNKRLFGGKLRPCILNFSRGRRFYGFFAPDRWEDSKHKCHEITLNPDCLKRPLIASFATLCHEMIHLWQRDFGNPSRSGYHNWQWAEKM